MLPLIMQPDGVPEGVALALGDPVGVGVGLPQGVRV
jgi:hypothetical protein